VLRKKRIVPAPPEPDELKRLEDAKNLVEKTEDRWPEVTRVARSMRKERAQNQFTTLLREAMGGR